MMYLLKMVIFHGYVRFPEGFPPLFQKFIAQPFNQLGRTTPLLRQQAFARVYRLRGVGRNSEPQDMYHCG